MTSPITDTAPGRHSPWKVQHHDYPPLCVARIPHSLPVSSQAATSRTDVPSRRPSGDQFQKVKT